MYLLHVACYLDHKPLVIERQPTSNWSGKYFKGEMRSVKKREKWEYQWLGAARKIIFSMGQWRKTWGKDWLNVFVWSLNMDLKKEWWKRSRCWRRIRMEETTKICNEEGKRQETNNCLDNEEVKWLGYWLRRIWNGIEDMVEIKRGRGKWRLQLLHSIKEDKSYAGRKRKTERV